MTLLLTGLLAMAATTTTTQDVPDELHTVAERTEYEQTSRYDDVTALMGRIAGISPNVRLIEMGRTVEGRAIPLLVLADPSVETADQARSSGRLVLFAFANIHAGEVCGKEALLMLARELALVPRPDLLDHLVIVFAPIYNADGNERAGPNDVNRPGQLGPREMGVRPNAQGLDLNRDYVKLEAPESQAMARWLTEWDPHLIIDLHTTNGSHHRYTLTYDVPLNPSGHRGPIEFARDVLLPHVTQRVRESTGYEMFFYGNFDRDYTRWDTYSASPNFGGPYHGLRGQMSILSEAYSYAPFRDRVVVTREFVREIMRFAAAHHRTIIELHEQAKRDTVAAGEHPQPHDFVGIRHRIAAHDQPAVILGYEMRPDDEGRPQLTDTPRDYTVRHFGRFEPTLSVRRPAAYILPPGLDRVVEKLRQHGIAVEPFAGEGLVEAYTVTDIAVSPREFQGHRQVALDVQSRVVRRSFDAGSHLVRTAQPLGTLAVYLLEPQADDGLAAWNFFDDHLERGEDFPCYRVRDLMDLEP